MFRDDVGDFMGQQDCQFAIIQAKTVNKQAADKQLAASLAFRLHGSIVGNVDFPLPVCGLGLEGDGDAHQAIGNPLHAGQQCAIAVKPSRRGQ